MYNVYKIYECKLPIIARNFNWLSVESPQSHLHIVLAIFLLDIITRNLNLLYKMTVKYMQILCTCSMQ